MTTEQDAERERRLRILTALFAKTKANGCSEEETMSAMDMATKKMQEWGIEDYELGIVTDKKTFVKRELNLKYGNKWRWELANTIAHNVGVLGLHFNTKKGTVFFYGREQPVEAGALLAEFVIGQIEELSAREYKSDLTGKRRFARGCATRVQQRIRRSYDLTADPRLPTIMKEAREEAKEAYDPDLKNKRSQNREEDTPEFLRGFIKGDHIALKKQQERIS